MFHAGRLHKQLGVELLGMRSVKSKMPGWGVKIPPYCSMIHADTVPTLFFMSINKVLRRQLIKAGALELLLLLPSVVRDFHWAHAVCNLLLEE